MNPPYIFVGAEVALAVQSGQPQEVRIPHKIEGLQRGMRLRLRPLSSGVMTHADDVHAEVRDVLADKKAIVVPWDQSPATPLQVE